MPLATLADQPVPDAVAAEALRATGDAVRLRDADRPDGVAAILAGLTALGPLRAVTGNDACQHALTGQFATPEISGTIGQVVGEIDLRLYLREWRLAYAVAANGRHSLHFFDRAGTALHTVQATDATDTAALAALADRFADHDAPPPALTAAVPPEAERPDAEVDIEGLRAAWRGLQYTHLFQAIPARFGIGRAQAMRLAGPDLARSVPASAIRSVSEAAAASGMPIMAFVGNRGCVQIHSGPVSRVEPEGPLLRVLAPRFAMTLRQDRVASAWLVRKPSVNGDIHALELFAANGTFACQLFGHRAAGGTERPDWRALLTSLPDP